MSVNVLCETHYLELSPVLELATLSAEFSDFICRLIKKFKEVVFIKLCY